MARGRGNNGQRGGRGGGDFNQSRGRGGGRGSPRGGQFTPRGGRGRGGAPAYTRMEEIDVDIQRYVDDSIPAYATPPRTPRPFFHNQNQRGGYRGGATFGGHMTPPFRGRGRGRGRGGNSGGGTPKYANQTPNRNSGANTPIFTNESNPTRPPPPTSPVPKRGAIPYAAPSDVHFRRDEPTERRRVSRGIGASAATYTTNVPLSQLLDRPLLRPVVFVRAQLQPVLFQRTEELLEGIHAEEEQEDDVPTADRVAEIFSPVQKPHDGFFYSAEDDVFASLSNVDSVMTIDFNSLGKTVQKLEKAHISVKKEVEGKGKEVAKIEETSAVVSGKMRKEGTGDVAGVDVVQAPAKSPGPSARSETIETSIEPKSFNQLPTGARVKATTVNIPTDPAILAAGPILAVNRAYSPGFRIDVTPTPLEARKPTPILADRISENTVLGQPKEDDDDDEVIVYDAPFPQGAVGDAGRSTPAQITETARTPPPTDAQTESTPKASKDTETAGPSFASATSALSFASIASASERNREQYSQYASPRRGSRRVTKIIRREVHTRTSADRQALFNKRSQSGGFGGTLGTIAAMLEEKHLQDDELDKPDPKKSQRRVGDSDLDWGDTSDDGVDQLSSDLGGMDIDPDVDESAYKAFVKRMAGVQAGVFVTMDDIADRELAKEEDESDEEAWERAQANNSSKDGDSDDEDDKDDELEEAFKAAEEGLIAEAGGIEGPISDSDDDEESEEDSDTSEDEEETPRRGFKRRLELLRARAAAEAAKGSTSDKAGTPNVDEDEDEFERNLTWEDKDDDYTALVDGFVEELMASGEVIGSKGKEKEREKTFRAVRDGDFDIGLEPARRRKVQPTHLPEALQAQWEADRAKKAEHKRLRQLDRIAAATDMLSQHRKGKKSHKAIVAGMRAAREYEAANRRDDSDSDSGMKEAVENAIVNPEALVKQMKRFLADPGAGDRMSLPAMSKEDRALVHRLADTVGLKSKSSGKDGQRYTTLIKKQSVARKNGGKGYTAFWDASVERKIMRIIGNWNFRDGGGQRGRGTGGMPRHKEGDEVGKAAPKIDDKNIGFQMLASMGWSEGDRIGLTGGIEVPLTAIIKTTKRGLGAS